MRSPTTRSVHQLTLLPIAASCYGTAGAAAALRSRTVSRGFGVTMIILHLGFVADVVAGLVLARRLEPESKRDPAGWRRSSSGS